MVLSDSERCDLRLLFANAVHYVFNNRLYLICSERKRVAVSDKPDGLSRTVNNHLASLALVQMLLQAGPDFRASDFLQVIPEFRKKLSAAEHRDSSFPSE